jgi:hypothetical protein
MYMDIYIYMYSPCADAGGHIKMDVAICVHMYTYILANMFAIEMLGDPPGSSARMDVIG